MKRLICKLGEYINNNQYHHFWLSDFRANSNVAKCYRDYDVSSFSFYPEKDTHADIGIYIKQ